MRIRSATGRSTEEKKEKKTEPRSNVCLPLLLLKLPPPCVLDLLLHPLLVAARAADC